MKKKIFALITAGLFLGISSVAFGFGGTFDPAPPAEATAEGMYETQGVDTTRSYDRSGCRGNDEAWANGDGVVGGMVTTYANATEGKRRCHSHNDGSVRAHEEGSIKGKVDVRSWTHAWDCGTTSGAKAGAKFDGRVYASGLASGPGGNCERVEGMITLGGYIYQETLAKEVGYSNGQGVSGGNWSSVDFETQATLYDTGCGYASDRACLSTKAITTGKTTVTIDPYGGDRSLSGMTETRSRMCTNGRGSALMEGAGSVGGYVANGPSYAGGVASFSYSGNANQASGQANINASVNTSGSGTSVSVSGSSRVSLGGNGQGEPS